MNNLVYTGLTCPSGTIGTVLRYHDMLRFTNDFIFFKKTTPPPRNPFRVKENVFKFFHPSGKK